jgi:hypothetical protein
MAWRARTTMDEPGDDTVIGPAMWPRLQFYAIGAVLVAIGAVALGQSAINIAGISEAPEFASAQGPTNKSLRFNQVDFSSTGSIKGQTIVLDPCTGRQKSP